MLIPAVEQREEPTVSTVKDALDKKKSDLTHNRVGRNR